MVNLADFAFVIALALVLAGFALVLLRRSLIFFLLGVELLFNAAMVIALVGGALWNRADGQILALFLMALSGAALAPTLALLLRVRKAFGGSNVDVLRHLRGGRDG
ncbi:MAG: NADH-quinone oxidoreductase subunit K [Acidithiobacillus caldus]|nr:NADH-quinone oxidoreductase subunit K [Acidithiobacillus caldus]